MIKQMRKCNECLLKSIYIKQFSLFELKIILITNKEIELVDVNEH